MKLNFTILFIIILIIIISIYLYTTKQEEYEGPSLIVSNLPPSVSKFIPLSLDELKTDRDKQYGAGGIGLCSFLSSLTILIIFVQLSSGNIPTYTISIPSGPTRFRKM